MSIMNIRTYYKILERKVKKNYITRTLGPQKVPTNKRESLWIKSDEGIIVIKVSTK